MRLARLVSCLLLAWILASPAAAVDQAEVLTLRAQQLAGRGQCAEALPLLREAADLAPNDANIPLLAGRCLIDARRFPEALTQLDRARSIDPSLRDLDLNRAIALYQLGDVDGAWVAIQRAEGRSSNEALYQLYLGLILIQRDQTREGALALERSRTLDPDAVEPVASFYSVLAWQSLEDRRRAEEALARVQAIDPDGPWAKEAERALRELEELERGDRRWWALATAGVEYDSNVGLYGTGVVLPTDISRRGDVAAVVGAELGAELVRTENWTVGALGSWQSRLYSELNEFDTHYPAGSLWVDRRVDEDTLVRARYDVTYGWVDWDPLVFTNAGTLSLFHQWGFAGDTEVSTAVWGNDFFQTDTTTPAPPGVNPAQVRDRDGIGFRVGAEHVFPLGWRQASIRGAYFYNQYWSEGKDWDYQAHEFQLTAAVLLPFDFLLDGGATYIYAPFQNPSSYPNPSTGVFPTNDRRDDVWVLGVGLERGLGEYVSVSARYTYTDNDSNVPVYNYDRQIVGGYVTVRFP